MFTGADETEGVRKALVQTGPDLTHSYIMSCMAPCACAYQVFLTVGCVNKCSEFRTEAGPWFHCMVSPTVGLFWTYVFSSWQGQGPSPIALPRLRSACFARVMSICLVIWSIYTGPFLFQSRMPRTSVWLPLACPAKHHPNWWSIQPSKSTITHSI